MDQYVVDAAESQEYAHFWRTSLKMVNIYGDSWRGSLMHLLAEYREVACDGSSVVELCSAY